MAFEVLALFVIGVVGIVVNGSAAELGAGDSTALLRNEGVPGLSESIAGVVAG
jgi:hypothetical protein